MKDERRLERFLGQDLEAEYELDLTGLDLAHSLASIDRMVERQRFRDEARQVFVRLDPPGPESGETLFQPVGRHLLGHLKAKLLSRCQPKAGEGLSGFYIELPAGKV